MDTLITSFGLDVAVFRERLAAAHGIIAGSAALAEWLRANGQEAGYEPGDLDIFLYTPESGYVIDKAKTVPLVVQDVKACQAKSIEERLAKINKLTAEIAGEQNMEIVKNKSYEIRRLSDSLMDVSAGSIYRDVLRTKCKIHSTAQFDALVDFMKASSVSCVKKEGVVAAGAYGNGVMHNENNRIHEVNEYTMASGKKVQIITISGRDREPLSDYIKQAFDLSCCMAYWDPATGALSHHYPEFTLKRRFVRLNVPVNDKRNARCAKYVERGFELRESMLEAPEFAADSEWHKVHVTDILTFDEPTVAEYLAENTERIVVKSGDSYYGFYREYLVTYLQQHKEYVAGKYRHKMPMGQKVGPDDILTIKNISNFIFDAAPGVSHTLRVLSV